MLEEYKSSILVVCAKARYLIPSTLEVFMAYPISDFARLSLTHTEEHPICAHCKKPILSQDGVERRFIDSQRVHEDCYFDALGEIIEQCPIGLPTRRG